MNQLLFTVLILVSFTSCITTNYTGSYKINLDTVSKDSVVITDTIKSLSFDDQLIHVEWAPKDKQFDFILLNKSDNDMEVVWEDALMVLDGKRSKVFHYGTQFEDRNRLQPATTVTKDSLLKEIIGPMEDVHYVAATSKNQGFWETNNLFITSTNEDKDIVYIESKKWVGRKVVIFLPIKQGNRTTNYIFAFTIGNPEITAHRFYNQKRTNTLITGTLFMALVSFAIVNK